MPENTEEVWIFRKNLRPRFSPADRQFRHVAYLSFHYQVTGAKKLPTAREMEMFSELEQELVTQEGDRFILVGVATKAGVRDFLFYARDLNSLQQYAASLIDRYAEYRPQLEISDDPRWKHYLEFPGGQDVQ